MPQGVRPVSNGNGNGKHGGAQKAVSRQRASAMRRASG
jgi:hypothetical protein